MITQISTPSCDDLPALRVANRALLDTLSLIAQTVAGSDDPLARTIYRLAKDAGAVEVGVRCAPGCQVYHTFGETREILRVKSQATLREMIDAGLKVSRGTRIQHSDIDAFMNE